MNQQRDLGIKPDEMREAIREHFWQLFVEDGELEVGEIRSDFFVDLPRLTDQEAEACEEPVILTKMLEALKDCGSSKAPGIDSLPMSCISPCQACSGTYWPLYTPTEWAYSETYSLRHGNAFQKGPRQKGDQEIILG